MTLSADLQDPQVADKQIGNDAEGHVVHVGASAPTDVVKRPFAGFDRVRYRSSDRKRREEGACAEEQPLSTMGGEMIEIRVP